jgi:hypothetical protein
LGHGRLSQIRRRIDSKLDRAKKAWAPSTITTDEGDRKSSHSNLRPVTGAGRRRTDEDDVSIAPSISDDDGDNGYDQDELLQNNLEQENVNLDDGEDSEDESAQLGDVAATAEEPNPADNPGLPLLWNMAERSETVPRTFSPELEVGENSSRTGNGERSEEDGEEEQAEHGHVELGDEDGENGDNEEESPPRLVSSPIHESPSPSSISPLPSRTLPAGPQHCPSGSTSLYPKPRLLSSDSKVRFSPRVRVKSGLRGASGVAGGSRVPSRIGSTTSFGGISDGAVEESDDVFATRGNRSASGHSRLGAMTTLDDPRPFRPTSHRSPSLTGLESTSLTSSASISLCASPPQHSWLFSGNSLSAALAGVNEGNTPGIDDRLGRASGGTDYFSFPGAGAAPGGGVGTPGLNNSNPPSRSSSLSFNQRRNSTLTPRDPEIEKLSADAARKRAESWAREHAAKSSSVSNGLFRSFSTGGGGRGGIQTPPMESPNFETSSSGLGLPRRTPSGGILIRTYSGRYLPPNASMDPNEVHYKTEQEVIWGSYWDRMKNPSWWSWKLIRGWKEFVRFWCSAEDEEDEDDLRERRRIYRRPR